MVRPRRHRRIRGSPTKDFFKPSGIRMRDLTEIILKIDEFEAIRLKDYEALPQEESAARMNISQPTFHRLIKDARRKVADAIINGKAIRIERKTL